MTVVRIADVSYALAGSAVTVRELASAGAISSEPQLLERYGFDRIHVARDESPYDLALAAARGLLERAGTDPAAIGLLIHCGPQGAHAFTAAPSPETSSAAHRTLTRFVSPGARLQHELGLERAMLIGIDQLACTSLIAAVRLARALCIAEGVTTALCVASEFFPADAGREAIWNCTSDAAAAVLVEQGEGALAIRAATQVTKGYYWDANARREEMIAAYFPTARHVIERTLARARWDPSDLDWIIPHNVNRRSWDVLRPLCGLGRVPIWDHNISRVGHTLAGDNFINLADAVERGDIERGQKLLLFSYGFGAHWTALAVEA